MDAIVTKDAIEFEEFPIRSLIATVLGNAGSDKEIDAIIEAVGPVSYSLPYTAAMSENKASVQMTLKPEVQNITMDNPEKDGLTIAVTISAVGENSYTLESKALRFYLTVDQIQLGENKPFSLPLNLAFDLAKK